jgi:hypothetical protein
MSLYVSPFDEHSEEIEVLTAKILTPGVAAALKKKLDDELTPIWEAAVDAVIEGAAESVSRVAADRATRYLNAVLAGDEKAAHELFGLTGFDGRRAERPVIHGKIFEADPVKLRRQLVEAHPDLLKDARIADLEILLEEARKQVADLQRREDQRYGRAVDPEYDR